MEVEGVLGKSESASGIDGGLPLLTLQIPHATVHSSLVAEAWLA